MKIGDLVKPRRNWHSRWYGHPAVEKIVGLVMDVEYHSWKKKGVIMCDVLWTGDIFEPGASAIGLEVVSASDNP